MRSLVRVHPGPPRFEGGIVGDEKAVEDEEKKKGGKVKKFFLFAAIAGATAWIVSMVKRRRSGALQDNEWQVLPPPQGG